MTRPINNVHGAAEVWTRQANTSRISILNIIIIEINTFSIDDVDRVNREWTEDLPVLPFTWLCPSTY